jgi:hypothetical protein
MRLERADCDMDREGGRLARERSPARQRRAAIAIACVIGSTLDGKLDEAVK